MYEQTGLVPVFDYSACVIKSDTLLDDDLRSKLIELVRPLENVPEEAKDWHPGSHGKVLDLVHPSLWPLVYGRTRIMPDNEFGLDECLELIGAGEIIQIQADQHKSTFWNNRNIAASSINFQWLPCNVTLSRDGTPKITSYINNLHPVTHKALYSVIEQFIAKALPAWDLVYRWPKEFGFQRLKTMDAGVICTVPDVCKDRYGCRQWYRPLNEDEQPREEEEVDDRHYGQSERGRLDAQWFQATHPVDLPDEKDDFCMSDAYVGKVKKEGFFSGSSRIQVIVKLANIHLTPDNPTYDGGSWHLEGQLNEHICATALYYYDTTNITESLLSFRTSSNREKLNTELGYNQHDIHSIARTFAVEENREASTLQDVGSVLTCEGWAIFFPNLFLHKVKPFALQDPTRPGHRKILALFLVDPKVPIISTSNVPPQQRHWWATEEYIRSKMNLPVEIGQMVLDNVDFPFGEAEAKRLREELIEERKTQQSAFANDIADIHFGFCEH